MARKATVRRVSIPEFAMAHAGPGFTKKVLFSLQARAAVPAV